MTTTQDPDYQEYAYITHRFAVRYPAVFICTIARIDDMRELRVVARPRPLCVKVGKLPHFFMEAIDMGKQHSISEYLQRKKNITQNIDISRIKGKVLQDMVRHYKSVATTRSDKQILCYRVGDFYEAIFNDARIVSDTAGTSCFTKDNIPCTGFPWYRTIPEQTIQEQLKHKGYSVEFIDNF